MSIDPVEAKRTVRSAVEESFADLPPGARVLVAVSGGADSLALAQAVALTGRPAAAAVIDHGLQSDSAEVAARAARECARVGLDPVVVERVKPLRVRKLSVSWVRTHCSAKTLAFSSIRTKPLVGELVP